MLNSLHKKIVIICFVMTGFTLMGMLLFSFMNAGKYAAKLNAILFQNTTDSITNKIRYDGNINSTWLAKIEADSSSIVHIENNGIALFHKGSWKSTSDRDALVLKAAEVAEKEYGFNIDAPPTTALQIEHATFLFEEENDKAYRCSIVKMPIKKDWALLVLLADLEKEQTYIADLRSQYIVVGLCCLGVLGILSWFLTSIVLVPLKQGLEKQNNFIAAASHELRTPVSLISASVDMLRIEPENSYKLLSNIDRECARLTRLMNDLLVLANNRSWSIESSIVDIDKVLIETIELFNPLAKKNNQSAVLVLPVEVLPKIAGDEERIKQILAILLENAIQHAKSKPSLELRAYTHNNHVVIEVVDHGIGIPDDRKKFVFDRFYKGDCSRSDKSHFGLGLSVAFELALLHKGSLSVKDTPNGGATFILRLPNGRQGINN